MKEELLQLYIEVIEEATSFYLSDYCNSEKEKEERLKDDFESVEYFKNILNQI